MTTSAHVLDLASFVSAAPTSYHAAQVVAKRLAAAGFSEVSLDEVFQAEGNQFVVREGAVAAWKVPNKVTSTTAVRIVGAHTDSPALKLKPEPSFDAHGWSQIGVEVYGGPLLSSWLDRDLGVAGRLVMDDGTTHLVKTGPIARVPQLAIHLDRTQNDGLALDPQQHMQPIVGSRPSDVLDYLARSVNASADGIVGHDLYTFVTEAPGVIGIDEELFASSRLDNLSSTHAGLCAFLESSNDKDICLYIAFDHEEVGSATTTGAGGPLLESLLVRIAESVGMTGAAFLALIARSSCVSADAGHLVHPNYSTRHDPHHHPVVNAGPLLKVNAKARYASDAQGAAIWRRACQAAGVPSQVFVSNNAVPCGSTIGPITATRLGITTVDVGVGLLSMHSTRELCGVFDPGYLTRALTSYFLGQ